MRHEWRILKAERTAQIVIALFVILTGFAIFNGFADVRRQQASVTEGLRGQIETYDAARKQFEEVEREKIAKGEPLNRFSSYEASPWAVQLALANFTAVLPPNSLAAVATGRSGIEPQAYSYKKYTDDSPTQPTVDAKSLGGVFPERVKQNPLKNLVGRFDLEFVMLYIYPLIILAIGFNFITADREAGTLQIALAQPIRLRTLVLGKILLRAALVFAFAVILPGIAVLLGHIYLTGDASISRLSLWFIAVTGYGAFWFSLVLLVNAVGKSASRNALVLTICWMAFVVLIPAGASLLAQTLFPTPSRIGFADAERAARFAGNAEFYRSYDLLNADFSLRYPRVAGDAASMERRERARMEEQMPVPPDETLLTTFFARRPDFSSQGLTLNQLSYVMYPAREEYIEARLAPLLSQMNNQKMRQQTTVGTLSFLSPVMLLQRTLREVAGTGRARHTHFLTQFDDYIRGRSAIFYPKMMSGETITASEFNRVPRFLYREESSRDVIKRVALPVLALIVLPLLLGFIGLRRYRRFSIIS